MSQTWKSILVSAGVGFACFSCSTPPASTDADLEHRSPFITVFPQPQPPAPGAPVATNAPSIAATPARTNAVPTPASPPAVTPAIPPVPVIPAAPALPAVQVAPPPPKEVTHESPARQSLAPHPAAPVRRATWVNPDSWQEGAGWTKPQRLRTTSTYTYEVRSSAGVLQFTAGSRTALWNGVNLELGFAPRLTNAQAQVHVLDIAKTFEPLNVPPAFLSRTNRIIVIDPGHGGENYGARSAVADRFEKDYALDWARRLEKLLVHRGWRVYLTRTNDVDVSLADRVAFADQVQADMFVSLHFNSTEPTPGHSDQNHVEQGGVETYCLTPVGMPSTITRQYEDELNHTFPNNTFDTENYWLATRIHAALVHSTKRKDRGVRRARFMGVLRAQNRPAVLIEGGYLTYAPEARLIAQAEYRQTLAEAVAKGLGETAGTRSEVASAQQ